MSKNSIKSSMLTLATLLVGMFFYSTPSMAINDDDHELTIIKQGGTEHFWSDFTYDKIVHKFEGGRSTYIECTGEGKHDCPEPKTLVNDFFSGSHGEQVSATEIITYAQKEFVNHSSGKTLYKGVFVSWKNAKVFEHKDGTVDYEYQIFISSRVKNVSNLIDIK